MNTKLILIAALLSAAFTPAMAFTDAEAGDAESSGGPAPSRHEVVRKHLVVNGNGHTLDHINIGDRSVVMHGKVVKNAPYSAEVVSEQVHSLADGNQIVNKSSSMSYRDSAGRTRQETRNAGGAVTVITIRDAVEGSTYILNPETRTATKVGSHREIARIAGDKARAAGDKVRLHVERMRKDGALPHEEIIVKRVERADTALAQRVSENIRIHVSKGLAEGRGMAGLEHLGPMMASAFGDMKWSGKAVTKDLGERDIEGVKAQGKVRSYEIPAGEIGNRNPIVVANETWYSPELQVTVLSRRSDPRSGERTYRLANIKRDEPAAALFAVPSDYTVKDVMSSIRKMGEEKK
jgi:hypothetical protein